MSGFIKKIWKDRVTEFPTRRSLTKHDGSVELVTVAREEGTVSQEGDAFSAQNMNDLEERVKTAFDAVDSSLNNKCLLYNSEDDYFYLNGVKTIFRAYLNAFNVFLSKTGFADGFSLGANAQANASASNLGSLTYDTETKTLYGAIGGINAVRGNWLNGTVDTTPYSKLCVTLNQGSNTITREVDITDINQNVYIALEVFQWGSGNYFADVGLISAKGTYLDDNLLKNIRVTNNDGLTAGTIYFDRIWLE